MTREELLQRISIDPNVRIGKACIRGTRIRVALVIEHLASGMSEAEILAGSPQLDTRDLQATLAYAAEITRERNLPDRLMMVKP